MGFLPGRILPLSTRNLSVATISPRLDQEPKCPAGDGDDGDGHDGGSEGDVVTFLSNLDVGVFCYIGQTRQLKEGVPGKIFPLDWDK